MKVIDGEFRLTVGQLRSLLEAEPADAVVVVSGIDGTGNYWTRTIYKAACAADESKLFLYSGSEWRASDALVSD